MKKSVKRILLILVLAAIAAGGIYTFLAPTEVPLTVVTPGRAELTFTEQGVVVAENVFQIYAPVQGEIQSVPVVEGQTVRAGDVLCVVDSGPLETQISQVRSAIDSYQVQKNAASTQSSSQANALAEQVALQNILIAQSQEDLDAAQKNLDRAQLLYDDGSIALTDLEAAQSAVRQHQTALDARKQELALLSAEGGQVNMAQYYEALIQIERANLAQLERDLEQCTILAAQDGVITKLYVTQTNYLSPTAPVAELTVTGEPVIEAFVTTKDVGAVHPGDEVTLTLSRREGDLIFPGQVLRVGDTAQTMISALGLEERRVKVEITPDFNALSQIHFGVGYEVDVRFFVYGEDHCLTVPKTALFQDGDQDFVWTVQGNKLTLASVEPGMELRTDTVILSGLEPGQFVVTDANNETLRQGLRVNTP